MAAVRTVAGDIDPQTLGRTDYHEHLFQVSRLLPGDELDDEDKSGAEAQLLYDAGITTMVDATPMGLGRDPAGVARISARTGMHIVATSGAHREPHYGDGHWLLDLSVQQLTTRFVDDVTLGMPVEDRQEVPGPAYGPSGRRVRAGLLKAGIGYWSISAFERRVLAAVGAAHVATGAPVMVHLEHGSAAFEVLAVLAEEGVSATAVALAHIDRNPDAAMHVELAATGCYLGYDGMARPKSWPDSVVLECLLAAASNGAGDQILLGGDVARRSRYIAYDGIPGLDYLPRRFLPRLESAAGSQLVESVLRSNPARWLGQL